MRKFVVAGLLGLNITLGAALGGVMFQSETAWAQVGDEPDLKPRDCCRRDVSGTKFCCDDCCTSTGYNCVVNNDCAHIRM